MEIPNVTASVLKLLREKIIIGDFKSGQKLNEYNLSAELNISRPPIREALRILEQDRLVKYVPRRGTYVSELSTTDFEEVSQVREMIECYAIDLIKKKAPKDRNLDKIESSLNKSSNLTMPSTDSIDKQSLMQIIKDILEFHYNLVEASGNIRLTHIYYSISHNLARYQYLYFRINGTVWHSLSDHKLTFELIKNGNYNQAKKKLQEHIHYTIDSVEKKVFTSNPSYAAMSDHTDSIVAQ
jgi:DNA-binding GntR family transcriptional regulator